MSPRRDPYFGRFAFVVGTIGFIIIVLGLVFLWYFFQTGGLNSSNSPLQDIMATRQGQLPPNQVLLYYTKNGKQLVTTVADIGQASQSPSEKARTIVNMLLQGRNSAMLKSPLPQGTKLNSIFINGNIVIINLSKEFVNNFSGGVDAEILAIYSIVNSILDNVNSVDSVQFLIEGERLMTLGGHIDIENPLIGNKAISRSS
jgi:spore germination protein GerM